MTPTTIPVLLLSILHLLAPAQAPAPTTHPTAQAQKAADLQLPSRADRLLAALNDPANPHVFVAAHRGDWRCFPENSLAGIDHAIVLGSDIIETDLRRTKDGHFIILHDKTLDRTTTGKGPVADFTLEQLQTLRLKDALGRPTHHPIPTLEQILDLTRDRALIYLDKTDDCIDEVYPILQKTNSTRHSFFYGRRPAAELIARYGPLAGKLNYIPKLDPNTAAPSTYIHGLQALLNPAVYILEFDRDDSPALTFIPAIQAAHARLWVSPIDPQLAGPYTDELAYANPDQAWGHLLAKGVTVFCTDRPGELVTYLRGKKLHD